MRNKYTYLVSFVYLIAILSTIYLAFNYFGFRCIIFIILSLRLLVYLWVSYLRVKRNNLDITTKLGKKEIKRLNSKINFWNGNS